VLAGIIALYALHAVCLGLGNIDNRSYTHMSLVRSNTSLVLFGQKRRRFHGCGTS
jgi:hypothetical protein